MRMDVRLHLIGLLFFLFEPVTMEVSVVGYVGGDVVLPCSHSGPNVSVTLSDRDMTFLWDFKDSRNVYKLIDGKPVLSDQDKQFRNRTTPSAPEKGDFSVTLTKLSERDGGRYTCSVPPVATDFHIQHVLLNVTAKRTPEPKKDPGNSSINIGPQKTLFLMIVMLITILSV